MTPNSGDSPTSPSKSWLDLRSARGAPSGTARPGILPDLTGISPRGSVSAGSADSAVDHLPRVPPLRCEWSSHPAPSSDRVIAGPSSANGSAPADAREGHIPAPAAGRPSRIACRSSPARRATRPVRTAGSGGRPPTLSPRPAPPVPRERPPPRTRPGCPRPRPGGSAAARPGRGEAVGIGATAPRKTNELHPGFSPDRTVRTPTDPPPHRGRLPGPAAFR
jgi:hypothetical protein